MKLEGFTRAVLEEAARLYLEEAYGDAPLPPAVAERLDWPAGETLAEIAGADAFERAPPEAGPRKCERIRLRLGKRGYPHMKLGVDRVPGTDQWVFTVDCHDAALVSAASESERAQAAALIRRNAAVKTRIERRWTEAGLETFERYIRSHLSRDGAGGPAGEADGDARPCQDRDRREDPVTEGNE